MRTPPRTRSRGSPGGSTCRETNDRADPRRGRARGLQPTSPRVAAQGRRGGGR
jgi:hypothetical protein